MRNQTSNTFNDGVNYDINPYQLPSTTMSDCVNGEILTQAGNEFILQNDKGNTYRTKIKDNYVPVGSKVYQGIAYILSAEVEEIAGVKQFTGRGEIGSFPSPDYSNLTLTNSQTLSGILLYEYQPFKNYLKEIYDPGDPLVLSESFSMYGTGSSVYGDFNTTQFNFTEKTSYSIEIQPSFDGSVNVIFTDNINPLRIINSRFSPLKSNRVNIIDRTGQKDVNLYHRGLFETTISLIQSSNKLINVDLQDIIETGVLPCGTYRYYLAYQTQDGNYTDVLAETFQIPIFKGSTQLDIDAPSDFNSGKSILISLKNLDTSFSQLRVYYTHHYGELAELSQTYLLTSAIPITGTSLIITHTGREESVPIDSSIISTSFSTIETVRTIAQTQSRLFLGNITLKGFDVATLSEFAANIKPRWGKRRFQFNPTAFSTRVISNSPTTTGEIGYINGYYNPFNVYYHGSYWGGETYMFGIVFILKSGATTPVFPIRGIDDWNANNSTNGYNTQTLNEANNYFDTINRGENLKGVYRFPTRVNQTYQQAFNLQDDSNNLNIFGLELDIPTDYPPGTIGCMFVRAPRVPDVTTQGLVIDTVAVPIVDTTPQDYPGNKYWNYTWRPDAIKYVPAYNYIVEGSRMSGDRNANPGTGDNGVTPFQLTDYRWAESPSNVTWKRRYALLTPTLYQESVASRINGSSFFVEQLGTIIHKATVPTEAWWEVKQHYAKWWSVLRQTKSDPIFKTDIKTSIEYVLAEQEATTINNFSATAAFSVERANTIDGNHTYAVIRNNYNAYLGLATTSTLELNTIAGIGFTGVNSSNQRVGGSDLYPTINSNFVVGSSFNTSVTANIYRDLGYNRGTNLDDLTRLASSNIPTNQQYTPISKRMYWDATFRPDNEGVIIDRNKSYWGGDCFPAETYRRMFYNSQNREGIIGGAEAVVNTGYTISYIVESDIIPTMRSTFIFNITEEATRRSFYPSLLDSNETPLEDRYNRNHQWRKYREVESNQINDGGKWLPEERIISPINPQLPFLRQRFPTRVMYSEINIYDSFLNGYRNIFPQNRQDYNQAYGEIIALKEINNVLICVQETAVSILEVNNREAVTDSSAGTVYLQGANVLSPYAQVLSGSYGSVLQDSVSKSESSVYGIDQQGGVWRVAQGGLQMISTGVLQSALKEFVPLISSREVNQVYNNIKFHYDQHKKTMYLSSYTTEEETGFTKLYTFVFSELTGKWFTRYSYIPIETFNINDKHFAFELKKNSQEIWEQHSNTIRCNYFGEQYEFEIEFCINADPMSQKIFTNFVIASNEVPPKYIMYDTDNEVPLDDVRPPFVAQKPMVQQDVHELHRGRYYNGNPLDLRNTYFNHNAAYKENHHYIQIDKNTNDTRDGKPPAKPELFDNNRQIRDKYLRVRFRYEGHEYSIIQAILTKYIISYS